MTERKTTSAAGESNSPNSEPMPREKTFLEFLARRGLKLTRQRREVVNEIFSGAGHFEAEELVERLKGNRTRVSRATVYRTLDLLRECQLVEKLDFGTHRSYYEHVSPDVVGNQRHVVVSDQSGRANILAHFREIGLDVDPDDPRVSDLVKTVKEREYDGYSYDGAEASFELLARRSFGEVAEYFRLNSFRITDERRWNAKGELITLSEATIKVDIRGKRVLTVAEGNGPVNALDAALRKALTPSFSELDDLRLVDYKVRILTPDEGTRAVTRVMIESADGKGNRWSTVGISANIIDASFIALYDSITYKLFRDGAKV